MGQHTFLLIYRQLIRRLAEPIKSVDENLARRTRYSLGVLLELL
jgi:hypothetical protein